MSESELAPILIIAGIIFVLIGVGLALVKADPDELRKKSRTNPGLALYRFSAYRWGAVILLFVFGVIIFVSGWNSLSALQ